MDNDLDKMDRHGHAAADLSEGPGFHSPLLQAVPHFEKIDGWLKLNAAELLFAAAASVKTGCIVEIGSYRGRSTVALCAGSMAGAKAPVYAIEPHEHFVGMKGGVFGPGDRRAFFRTMLMAKYSNIVRLINAKSEVVTPGWDKTVSLLFVDGDHRYEAVLTDFTSWRPHLVDHAIVIFHDVAGTGPALVIKDLLAEGALTHMQTVGRLALFRFHAVNAEIDPDAIPSAGVAPALPGGPDPVGPREGVSLHAVGEQVYFSERGNYLYQPIAKCGAATVKTALLDLEGLKVEANGAKRLSKDVNKFPGTEMLRSHEEADLLAGKTDAFKFTFVRDPYTRMAAVYADKILGGYARASHFWINQIVESAEAQGVTLSETITFEEFVRVVSGQRGREMDPQWRHQFHCGRFDVIKFDFVGKVETMAHDLGYVLERLKAPAELMHRAIRPLIQADTSVAIWTLVSRDVRAEFLKKFAVDFEAFRYPMRHASVVFMPVNVDRPAPLPLPAAPDGKRPKGLRRKPRKAAAEAEAGTDVDMAATGAMNDD